MLIVAIMRQNCTCDSSKYLYLESSFMPSESLDFIANIEGEKLW